MPCMAPLCVPAVEAPTWPPAPLLRLAVDGGVAGPADVGVHAAVSVASDAAQARWRNRFGLIMPVLSCVWVEVDIDACFAHLRKARGTAAAVRTYFVTKPSIHGITCLPRPDASQEREARQENIDMRHLHILMTSAILGLGFAGAALADDPRLPPRGSEQGEIVPNALPDGGPAHVRAPERHLIAPTGAVPQSSAQSVQPRASLSGATGPTGEAQPHADVTASPKLLPNSSAAGIETSNSMPPGHMATDPNRR